MAEDAVTGLAITAVAVPRPGDEGTERAASPRACRAIRDAHGTVPLNLASTGFARAAGYELEQVERSSRLQLPVDPGLLASLEADARAHSGG